MLNICFVGLYISMCSGERKRLQLVISVFQVKTVKINDDLLEDEFAASVKMSTYLVAFVICDFTFVSGTTSSGVKVWFLHAMFSFPAWIVASSAMISALMVHLLMLRRCPSMLHLRSGCRPTTPWRLLSKCWTSMKSISTFATRYPNKVRFLNHLYLLSGV